MKRPPIPKLLRKHPSIILVWGYVIELLLSPLVGHHPVLGLMLLITIFISTLLSALVVHISTVPGKLLVVAAVVWFVSRMIEIGHDPHRVFAHVAPVAGLVASLCLVVGIIRRFSQADRVTRDILSEAFACYLLIAVAFSQLYWILNEYVPHAFSIPVSPQDPSLLLYLSVTTLSSAGNNIIGPIHPFVRLLAAFETIIGIFYIAIVVSRLVSTYRREADEAD